MESASTQETLKNINHGYTQHSFDNIIVIETSWLSQK